jgi:hypothetical protein
MPKNIFPGAFNAADLRRPARARMAWGLVVAVGRASFSACRRERKSANSRE